MRRSNGLIGGTVLALLCVSEPSTAEVVRYHFTGKVTFGTICGSFRCSSGGDAVSGSFSYDTSLPATFNDGQFAIYSQPPPSEMSIQVAGMTIQSGNGISSLHVFNDFPGGGDDFGGFFTPLLLDGESYPGGLVFDVGDLTQTAFSTLDLPTTLSVESLPLRAGAIVGGGPFNFSIDTLTKAEELALLTAPSPVDLWVGLKNSCSRSHPSSSFDPRLIAVSSGGVSRLV